MQHAQLARSRTLLHDLQAGTTTAVVLVPQAMAYALVAGLPPIHGLYASVLPLLGYALVGRSRELAVGPGAVDTLLVGAALAGLAATESDAYPVLAAMMAVQVAIIQVVLGAIRGGFVINFLSRPVISGFTSAAALTIALSQWRHLFGFETPRASAFYEMVWHGVRGVGASHAITVAIGVASVLALIVMRRISRKIPAPLLVVMAGGALTWFARWDLGGVEVIGSVPAGLPMLGIPTVSVNVFFALIPSSITIALISYLTMISIASTYAQRGGYEVEPNRELVAGGVANLFAGLSQGFPISASFSRTAVNARAGARSPRSLVVSAAWVALTLVLLTPAFTFIPLATLAAIIMTSVMSLFDVATARRIYRVKRQDLWLLVLTFVATLTTGFVLGILIGVAASLLLFVFRSTRPHAAVLGRVPGGTDYRNIRNVPEAITIPGFLIVRIDAQLYFGNVTFLKGLLHDLEEAMSEPLRCVVIEACSLNQLDSTADAALHALIDEYHARDVKVAFATIKRPVARVMRASGLWDKLGDDGRFMNVHEAIVTLTSAVSSSEESTPSYDEVTPQSEPGEAPLHGESA